MTIADNLKNADNNRPEFSQSAAQMAPIAVVTSLVDRQFGVVGNKASGTLFSGKGMMNFGVRWITHFLLLLGADQVAPYADAVIVKPIKDMTSGEKKAPE